jgi:large subunit ribosomal protein L10
MRPERESLLSEVRDRLDKSTYAILVDYLGLSVEQITELRANLKQVHGGLMVARNSIIKRAMSDLGWDVSGGAFEGPSSIVFGTGDPTAAVKAIKAFRRDGKDKELPALKCGWLGGSPLSRADAEALADIPSREILLGRVVGTVAAPMTGLVGVLKQKLSSVVYVLKAIEEKKG